MVILFLDMLFLVADVKLTQNIDRFQAYTRTHTHTVCHIVFHDNVTDTVKKLCMKRGHQIIFKIRIRRYIMDIIITGQESSIAII